MSSTAACCGEPFATDTADIIWYTFCQLLLFTPFITMFMQHSAAQLPVMAVIIGKSIKYYCSMRIKNTKENYSPSDMSSDTTLFRLAKETGEFMRQLKRMVPK